MKKYLKPTMDSEVFVTNEFISACYHGKCNISGYVFTDTNNNGVYDKGIDTYKYYNSKCEHDYWIQGQSSTLPEKNSFVFKEYERVQIGVEDVYIPFVGWVEQPVYEYYGSGAYVEAWNFDETHTTTTMDLQNRPNHS